MFQTEEEMEESYANTCVNCGFKFRSEGQTNHQSRTSHFSFVDNNSTNFNEKLVELEIQIADAIYHIFGLSYDDIYPENHSANQYPEVLVLCSECIPLLHKLYDCFKDFKNMSNDISLLWTSIQWKRNKVAVKRESPSENFQNAYSPISPSLGFTDTSTGNLKTELFNPGNDNGHPVYSEATVETRQGLISGDIFQDNFLVEDTTDLDPEGYFVDDYEDDYTRPEIKVREQIVESKFPKTSHHPKRIKKSKFKGEKEAKMQQCHDYKYYIKKEKDNSETGNKRIKKRLKKQKRFTKLSKEFLNWKVAHLDSIDGVAPIKCCNVNFQSDVDFTCHVRDNHENESEKLEQKCGICKKKILSKYMDFHVKVLHQDLSVFECSICQKFFASKSQARKHRQRNHPKLRERSKGKRIFCEECKKYFEYCYFHRYHKPVIHRKDEKKFQCQFCGSSLNSEAYLKTHIHLYHGESNSKCCDKCGKIFRNQYNLSRHKRIHEADLVTDKEKFKCTQCGITLKHSASLRKHMYIMHGKAAQKIFTCDQCGKTTKSMTNMRIHMKVHDPNRTTKLKPPVVKNLENIITQAEVQAIATIEIPDTENTMKTNPDIIVPNI